MTTQEDILGTDIKLTDGDIQFDFNQDFKTVSGKSNLAQALKNRLNTFLGELTYYPNYGSRLLLMLGERNTILTQNEGKGYIFESIINEPRIIDITEVQLEISFDTLTASCTVIPINETIETNLVFNIE